MTPWFPTQWPPSSETPWLRYGYARGQEFPPRIADGEQVSKVLLRAELIPYERKVKISWLQEKIEAQGIQGIRPLMPDEAEVLRQDKEIKIKVLGLQSLPPANDATGTQLKKYYRLWLQTNGVIADQIKGFHPAFFAWVVAE